MTKFFCENSPIHRPEQIIPFLGKGEKHWRQGRSAYELAHSWMDADGIPPSARGVLETRPEFSMPELLEGYFERKTEIPGRGGPSQTDLLALCEANGVRFVLAVEGKVDETLGPLVSVWDNGTPNRQARLAGLVGLIGGNPATVADLRYQLFHRSASALIEAKTFGVKRATMLVHSFDPGHAWFEDFARFSRWVGAPCEEPNTISEPILCSGIEFYLGWCADMPLARYPE